MRFFSSNRSIDVRGPKPQKEIFVHPKNKNISVHVRGYGNTVRVETRDFHGFIRVTGVNNTVVLEEGVHSTLPVRITVGDASTPVHDCEFHIARGAGFANVTFYLMENGSRIDIGEGTMASFNVDIWNTDGHLITGEDRVPRPGRELIIGKHVWIGKDVKIGKNCRIADGCMIGWSSVVAGRFEEPNCLIAGVPAQVRKRNIHWDLGRVNTYLPDDTPQLYPDWSDPPPPSRFTLFFLRPFLKLRLRSLRKRLTRLQGHRAESCRRKITYLENLLSD